MGSSNQVAIVTGASKGYGREVAKDLIAHGWTVVGDARGEEPLRAFAESSLGGRFLPIAGDVQDPSHRRSLVAQADAAGVLRLLVNNAGGLGPTPMPQMLNLSPADLVDTLRVNAAAPLALVCDAQAILVEGGAIVNLTSDAAANAYPGWGAYSISKAALEKGTDILAVEDETRRYYSLDPGDLRTDMHQAAFPEEDISDRPTPDATSQAVRVLYESAYPSGRYVAAEVLKESRA